MIERARRLVLSAVTYLLPGQTVRGQLDHSRVSLANRGAQDVIANLDLLVH